ncbi:DUF192 domain-containing protein [Pseudoclostridium thermosuccinogenes]|uniref:DUF192 domain-containing protein n=1 Tax=Clostridium thermosuccinogenes TaxID=84032 RepID=UPI002FD8C750
MKIINATKQQVICTEISIADTFMRRFLGLMGKKEIPPGKGLIITPCNSIHTFFMRMPLDIIFIDKSNIALHVIENLQPWRISPVILNARSVIEVPSGTVKKTGTTQGDRLEIV